MDQYIHICNAYKIDIYVCILVIIAPIIKKQEINIEMYCMTIHNTDRQNPETRDKHRNVLYDNTQYQ